jgi:nucleoside-diphosphate-sugar epimerase
MQWTKICVLVTGGASFIGSHLVDALVERGAQVRVVDNLSSGRLDNLRQHLETGRVEFIQDDLLNPGVADRTTQDMEYVFHLAADHGGRGYVDLHQAACATNLALDGIVFHAARKAGVYKVVFASSGCVYPNFLQSDVHQELYLTEDLVKPPYDADHMYGWAKLMAELTLKAFHQEWGLRAASCRYFTVYGTRGHENHAVIAMIARSFIDQEPFEVWGTGEQIRNWTHVSDIVAGTLLAAEKIDDATAVNLGTMERIRVIDAAREVLRYTGKEHLHIVPRLEMPVGPLNRVADNRLAAQLLGWQPKVKFMDGLHDTIDWYYANKNKQEVAEVLGNKLTQR